MQLYFSADVMHIYRVSSVLELLCIFIAYRCANISFLTRYCSTFEFYCFSRIFAAVTATFIFGFRDLSREGYMTLPGPSVPGPPL